MEGNLVSWPFFRALLGEICGTFFLIFLGCGGASGRTPDSVDLLHVAFAFGLGIGATVHLFSDISGGHLNPAVSLALFVARKCSLVRAVVYMLAQTVGGFLGAVALLLMCPVIPGVTVVGEGYTTIQGLFFEFFGTLFLVLTVLATTNSKRGFTSSYLQPLAIGIAIFVAHLVLIVPTQCGINPVRGVVINIVAGQVAGDIWIWVVGPLLASVVGGALYEFVLDPHYNTSYIVVEEQNGHEETKA